MFIVSVRRTASDLKDQVNLTLLLLEGLMSRNKARNNLQTFPETIVGLKSMLVEGVMLQFVVKIVKRSKLPNQARTDDRRACEYGLKQLLYHSIHFPTSRDKDSIHNPTRVHPGLSL